MQWVNVSHTVSASVIRHLCRISAWLYSPQYVAALFRTYVKASVHSIVVEASNLIRISSLCDKHAWFVSKWVSHIGLFMITLESMVFVWRYKPVFQVEAVQRVIVTSHLSCDHVVMTSK
jgi:hypothetical protein